jgi:hypothetical protein
MRQSVQSKMHEVQTKNIDIPGTKLPVSRLASGTWPISTVGWPAAQHAGVL